jgi:hypothetical protein
MSIAFTLALPFKLIRKEHVLYDDFARANSRRSSTSAHASILYPSHADRHAEGVGKNQRPVFLTGQAAHG